MVGLPLSALALLLDVLALIALAALAILLGEILTHANEAIHKGEH